MKQGHYPTMWQWIAKGRYRIVQEVKPNKWVLLLDFSSYRDAATAYENMPKDTAVKCAFVYDSTL